MKFAKKCLVLALLYIVAFFGISGFHTDVSSAEVSLPADMPYVFVYPENIVAEPGENITVTVAVFNLTENVYASHDEWNPGDPLPPYHPDGMHTYPLGFLVGFEIKFSWDPIILEYLNHTVTVPVEDYSDPIPPLNYSGTLHEPIQPVEDDVNATLGTYLLAKSHLPTSTVNYFVGNGTFFQMTFRVKKEGGSRLTIESCKLSAPFSNQIGQTYSTIVIPHGVKSGFFLTSGARTRIYSMDVSASVGTRLFDTPIIVGENGSVKITVRNEGSITDYYNLTLYQTFPNGTTSIIDEWLNQEINTTQREQDFQVSIDSSLLERGVHSFVANASILHGTEVSYDSISKVVRVISADLELKYAPLPDTIYVGDKVTFDASGSNHSEPTGFFVLYTWEIREHSDAPPRAKLSNSTPTAEYTFPSNRTWTISLILTDNFGVTYNKLRPATAAYRLDFDVEVLPAIEGGFPWDLVLLAVIIIVVIAAAGYFYMRRRR